MNPENVEGTFERDTLVFAMGSLSTVMLSKALADAKVISRYESWTRAAARHASPGTMQSLVRAGMGEGMTTLFARAPKDEFCLHCDHPSFRAWVAVCVQVSTLQLIALRLVHFEGQAAESVRFALELAQRMAADAPTIRTPPDLHFGPN
ncbi:MAG: hypothetical protein AAGD10_10035 [Myxococcota bacterium]